MKHDDRHGRDAWDLLVRFFFVQRSHLPTLAADFDLSAAQCHVLRLMEPGRAMPMGRLAATLACDASNVTGLIDRLESRGLVRRRPLSADRRIKVLRLTPSGARLRTLLLARITTPPETLARLSVAERRALVRILSHLLE
jgi:DNA-binding MarR family transcriptional regulator